MRAFSIALSERIRTTRVEHPDSTFRCLFVLSNLWLVLCLSAHTHIHAYVHLGEGGGERIIFAWIKFAGFCFLIERPRDQIGRLCGTKERGICSAARSLLGVFVEATWTPTRRNTWTSVNDIQMALASFYVSSPVAQRDGEATRLKTLRVVADNYRDETRARARARVCTLISSYDFTRWTCVSKSSEYHQRAIPEINERR